MIYVDQNYKLMGGHKVKTSSRNPYNGPGGPPRIIDGTGTGTRLILLDLLLQETVHVVLSLYLQEPTGITKIKMAESRRMEE